MAVFIQGNPALDFFDQNPELQFYPKIQELLQAYGPEVTSKLMWAVYLFEDPNSKFYRIPSDTRKEEIAVHYLEDKDFDWGLLTDIMNSYPQMALSKEQMLYKMWTDKIDEGLVHIKSMSFVTDSTKIVALLDKIGKMWPTYEKVQKKMEESNNKTAQIRGGASLSIRERRQAKRSKSA